MVSPGPKLPPGAAGSSSTAGQLAELLDKLTDTIDTAHARGYDIPPAAATGIGLLRVVEQIFKAQEQGPAAGGAVDALNERIGHALGHANPLLPSRRAGL